MIAIVLVAVRMVAGCERICGLENATCWRTQLGWGCGMRRERQTGCPADWLSILLQYEPTQQTCIEPSFRRNSRNSRVLQGLHGAPNRMEPCSGTAGA